MIQDVAGCVKPIIAFILDNGVHRWGCTSLQAATGSQSPVMDWADGSSVMVQMFFSFSQSWSSVTLIEGMLELDLGTAEGPPERKVAPLPKPTCWGPTDCQFQGCSS